jgi:ParB family chromosome partitioning protein
MKMAIDRIVVANRLRPVEPARVAGFVERPEALDTPIIVRPASLSRWPMVKDAGKDIHLLVAGGHRLAAAKELGRKEIEVIVKALDDVQAVLAEVAENLHRHELTVLDRGVFVAAGKAAWDALHPEARRGGDRRSKEWEEKSKLQSSQFGFSETAAAALGLSERTIHDAVALVKALGPEAVAQLQRLPIADNRAELKALVKIAPRKRDQVVKVLTEGKGLSEAMLGAGLVPPKPSFDEQAFQTLVATWSRATPKVRKRFLAQIGKA